MIKFSLAKKLHAPGGIIILNVSCQVEKGQFISLYGASGAGKTSILRMLGGFMQPDKGEIICNGEVWYNSSKKINVPPQKRKIGFVFQDYALFPNMNVRENLLFALDKDASINIVDELLATIGLADLQKKSIHTLSGGQKQRIALARALVRRPSLLLLDEPLSAVDNEMRERLQDTLLQVHQLYNLTTILVSHDLPEIGKLSDKTIWMENGVVKDYRTPAEMFFTNTCEGVNLVGIVLASQPGISCFTSTILIGGQIIKIETTQQLPKGEKVNVKAGDVKVSINV